MFLWCLIITILILFVYTKLSSKTGSEAACHKRCNKSPTDGASVKRLIGGSQNHRDGKNHGYQGLEVGGWGVID